MTPEQAAPRATPEHSTTIGSDFLDDGWTVTCSCGFVAGGFSSMQWAGRAIARHRAFPTEQYTTWDEAS